MSSCKLGSLISQASGKGLSSSEGFFFSWEFEKDFAMRQLCWFRISCRQRNAFRVCKLHWMYCFYIKNEALETELVRGSFTFPSRSSFAAFSRLSSAWKEWLVVNYVQERTDLASQETSQRIQLYTDLWGIYVQDNFFVRDELLGRHNSPRRSLSGVILQTCWEYVRQ